MSKIWFLGTFSIFLLDGGQDRYECNQGLTIKILEICQKVECHTYIQILGMVVNIYFNEISIIISACIHA